MRISLLWVTAISAVVSSSYGQTLDFIRKQGDQLVVGSQQYVIAGANVYWLGLDENVVPNPSYPSKTRINEIFTAAAALGVNTIRAHSLGVSTGHALSLMPSKGTINQNAFDAIDYAVYAARQFNVRLIIPFTDNYKYYHGGKFDFLRFNGLSDADSQAGAFYTNSAVIADFELFIRTLLTHRNSYTGLLLSEDPIILAWETGNELGGPVFQDRAVPVAWTTRIANLTKSLAPNHLFIDGTYGINSAALSISAVDIYSNHFWPTNVQRLQNDIPAVRNAGKLYFAGEYDWTKSDLPQWYSAVESYGGRTVVGDAIWFLLGRDDACSRWLTHEDGTGTTLNYPGSTSIMQQKIPTIRNHKYRLRGLTPPTAPSTIPCPATLPGGGGTSSTTATATRTSSTLSFASTSSATTSFVLTTRTSTSSAPATTTRAVNCAGNWQQCGGVGWTGPTCCTGGWVCSRLNDWYFQCLAA